MVTVFSHQSSRSLRGSSPTSRQANEMLKSREGYTCDMFSCDSAYWARVYDQWHAGTPSYMYDINMQ